MDNRHYLEQKVPHFNGNKYVIGILEGGTRVTLSYEVPHLSGEQMLDVDTGIIFQRGEFQSFENCPLHGTHLKTKNHHARNHHQYLTSGKNHREDKGDLSHLVK